MADFDLRGHLEKMECHFNWQLDCSQSTLKSLNQDLEDRLKIGCNWTIHLYNLLGYVLQTQGSSDEALTYLKKAEKMIREEPDNVEKHCLLLVNQANLAWVHYHRGELAKSETNVQEVDQLEGKIPVPSDCDLHPDVAGQKGWSLLKFEIGHKHRAIECFKMALRGDPLKKNFHKGLALALEKGYKKQELDDDLKMEIVEKLRVAKEMDGNDVCVGALYLINAFPNVINKEAAEKEADKLIEKLVTSGRLDGLNNMMYLLMYHFKDCSKALSVAEKMQTQFPTSTRAKKNLANCLMRNVYSLREETEERTNLARRTIALYEELKPHYSVKSGIHHANMHIKIGNMEDAEKVFQSLLDRKNLSDAEKQVVYLKSGEYFFGHRKMTTEAVDRYKKAVQIPLASDNRDQSIKHLASTARFWKDEEIQAFLLDLLCADCRHHGKLFLTK